MSLADKMRAEMEQPNPSPAKEPRCLVSGKPCREDVSKWHAGYECSCAPCQSYLNTRSPAKEPGQVAFEAYDATEIHPLAMGYDQARAALDAAKEDSGEPAVDSSLTAAAGSSSSRSGQPGPDQVADTAVVPEAADPGSSAPGCSSFNGPIEPLKAEIAELRTALFECGDMKRMLKRQEAEIAELRDCVIELAGAVDMLSRRGSDAEGIARAIQSRLGQTQRKGGE